MLPFISSMSVMRDFLFPEWEHNHRLLAVEYLKQNKILAPDVFSSHDKDFIYKNFKIYYLNNRHKGISSIFRHFPFYCQGTEICHKKQPAVPSKDTDSAHPARSVLTLHSSKLGRPAAARRWYVWQGCESCYWFSISSVQKIKLCKCMPLQILTLM